MLSTLHSSIQEKHFPFTILYILKTILNNIFKDSSSQENVVLKDNKLLRFPMNVIPL